MEVIEMTTTTKIFTVTTIKGKELEITKTTDTFEAANIVDHNFSNGKMTIVQFYANIKGKARRLEKKFSRIHFIVFI